MYGLSKLQTGKGVSIGTPMVPSLPLRAEMFYVRSLSVQSKLIAAFVLLTLVAIGVVSWIGYVSARESLRAASERELMGLQRSKAALVQNILKSARNEVLSLSASQAATDAARELLAAYRQLARETVSPEMQAEVRRFYKEEFEPALRKRAAIEPPEDSLLPTTQTGWYLHYHYFATGGRSRTAQDVATARPQTRARTGRRSPGHCLNGGRGQSARTGKPHSRGSRNPRGLLQSRTVVHPGHQPDQWPLCGEQDVETRLGLRNSQNVDDYRVADFEAYYPALGQPMAFVATPVFDGPRMIAIMMLRLPIEPISNALSGNRQWEAEGLGKTGEVYLLGPDQTMRNDSRFLIEDRAAFLATLRRSTLTSRTVDTVEKLGTTILTVPVRTMRPPGGP